MTPRSKPSSALVAIVAVLGFLIVLGGISVAAAGPARAPADSLPPVLAGDPGPVAPIPGDILAVASYNGQPGSASARSSPAVQPAAHTFFPWVDLDTTLFVQNPAGGAGVAVMLYLYDLDGVSSYSDFATIPGNGSLAWDLGTFGSLPAGFEGSAVLESDGPIAAAASVQPASNSLLAYNGAVSGDTEVVLPSIMRQYYGWNTSIWVQNTGSTPADVMVDYYAYGGGLVDTYSDTIPPYTSHVYRQEDMLGLPTGFNGLVRVAATEPVAAAVEMRNSVNSQAGAYDGLALATAGHVLLSPRQQKAVDGWSSATQVTNLGAVDAGVDADWYSGDGSTSWTQSSLVAPMEAVLYYLPGLPDIPDGFDGSLIVDSDQTVAALVNWTNVSVAGDGFSTNPTIGLSQLATSTYLAHVAHSLTDRTSTEFSIQNPAMTATDVTITFYNQSGAATVTLNDTISSFGVHRYATGDVGALGDEWEGSVTIESTQPVAVEAVQLLMAPEVSTCPVVSNPDDSGSGTLRDCLERAGTGDTITFDTDVFPPGSPVSITVASDLPSITQGNLTIDASDAGVILDGSSVIPNLGEGLYLISDGNSVVGLQIFNFPGDGIEIYGGSNNTIANNVVSGNSLSGVNIAGSSATGNRVVGNRVGTDASGTTAVGGHPLCGVRIGGGARYNTIGGDTEDERNLISGNDDDGVCINDSGTMSNTVSGNYIGTDISGTTAIPNAFGVSISAGAQYNTVGGSNYTPGGACTGECNLVSGNDTGMLLIRSGTNHNVITGNYIGTDPTGTFAVPNHGGIWIVDEAQHNVIGGTTPGERNVISGNSDPIGGPGISIEGPSTDYNVVIGNHIGTDAIGLAAIPNGGGGVVITDGAEHNTVGGNTPEERNLISGNNRGAVGISGAHNTVIGNYIGVDVTGLVALGNGGGVGVGGTYNRVGGTTSGERNIISGNDAGAVYIENSGTMSNTVLGNYIGTDIHGTAAIPNGWGVQIWSGAQRNTVGGSAPGEGNLISGNSGDGIIIQDNETFTNTVSGNYIGTTANGTAALANDGYGIHIHSAASHNVIGGVAPGQGNLISGNASGGVGIGNGDSNFNLVSGNDIGTDASGTAAIPNGGDGVSLWWNASWNSVGVSNTIAFNAGHGVSVDGGGTLYNTITRNSIHSNMNQGIALSDGGNGNLSAPTVLAFDPGSGTASGTALSGCTVEVYSDAGDEGRWFEGEIVADGGGSWSFSKGSAFVGPYVQATCTDASGNTSEFSPGIPDTCPLVSSSADSDPGTLRQCLALAGTGDTITFDTGVFPPGSPVSITLATALPIIITDNLTIDASNAGVILDGSSLVSGDGLHIQSNGCTVQGLQILHFPENGIVINDAANNTIGGSNSTPGADCSGDCNLISGNGGDGVRIEGSGTVSNTVSGNYIGTGPWGMERNGNMGNGVAIDAYASHNRIGGTDEGQGNLISGNDTMALFIRDSSDNQVLGNLVGTDATGTAPLSNVGGLGVYWDAKRNLIEHNVIASNNFYGLQIALTGATDNVVRGNWIGTNTNGHDLGNTWGGIEITSQAGYNTIGPDNVIKYNDGGGVSVGEGHDNLFVDNEISHNDGTGVAIAQPSSLHNTITRNSIYANWELGIDLRDGGNTELPAPEVVHYDLAAGIAEGTACSGCVVEVFSDDGDEGRWYAGTVTATVAGDWAFAGDPFPGHYVHATATDADGNTSEFSLSADTCPLVSSLADDGPGTLRRCLETAEVGEVITFDTAVFPPSDPATIALMSELPLIVTDSLTIDGSNAGVIVDGSQVGATPEIVLLDDISLTLDGGPNLINNGDFSSGLDYWQASDEHPGATRTLNSSDYFSAPPSLEWGLVAHTRESSTNYTEWISAAEGSTIVVHLWYRYGRVAVNLDARFAEDDDTIREQWLPWQADWTEATIVETVPPGATAVSVSFVREHSEMRASGLASSASDGTIQGLQVVNFPGSGIWLLEGAQYTLVGGDSTLGVAPLGRGNLLSGNYANGIRIEGVGTMSNTVSGNWIGTDASGTSAFGNLEGGVLIIEEAANNLIGGQTEGERNVITYNHGDGIGIGNWGTNENRIEGNWIGVDADGTREVAVSLVIYSPDYATDQTIFLGTEGQGVWKSTDGGAHWAEMNNGLTDLEVTAMAVSPDYAADGTLFAGTDSGVFKSTDGGTSWMDVSPASGGDSILSVALSPDYGSDQTVLLGNIGDAQVGGVWKSTDGGATWQNVAPASGSQQEVKQADALDQWEPGADPWLDGMQREPGLWDGERAQGSALQDGGLVAGSAVAFSPDYATDQTMFVGGYDSGYNGLFFKSEDGGGTWARIDSGLGGTQVDTIAVSPDYGNDGTLFVIRNTFFGLPFRSTDGGATWTQLTNGLPDDYSWAHGLALSPGFAADGTLFIPYGWGHMGVRGLFRSSDRGDTWIRTSPGVLRQQALGMVAVSPEFVTDDELLLAVGRNGLLRSTNRGDTWTYANGDLTDPGNDGNGVGIYDWASGNIVGGSAAGQRNLISNNGFNGILLEEEGTSQNVISGNYIGTNADGSSGLGNRTNGVEFSDGPYDNRIGGHNPALGGLCSGECNLISGNGNDGIGIRGGSEGNTISGNYIGMNADGTAPIGNGYYGINIYSGYNLVGGENGSPGGACSGECNLISGNVNGLQIVNNSAIGNTVTGNYIGTDVNGTTAIPSLGWEHSNNVQTSGPHNRIGGATPAERNVMAGPISIAPPYAQPTHNQFIGNYIGVDATGTACIGQGWGGISIWGSDHVIGGNTPTEGNQICGYDGNGISVNGTDNLVGYNTVHGNTEDGILVTGSDNLLAHNEIHDNNDDGVEVRGETALRNTITENSIHDNESLGIDLVDGGNTELWAPVLLATDVTAGTASGTACAGCTVEVFADDGDEGRWFITGTVAGPDGAWSIDTGDPFPATHVHATATDADGNTSEFSRPVHDVAVVSAVPSGEVPVGEPCQVHAELRNTGSQLESDVPVQCTIEDSDYDETETSGEILPADWAMVQFADWTPAAAGVYTLTCQSMLPGDGNPGNDVFTQVVTATLDDPPDVWTRDNEEDTGDVPSDSPWWVSPDIWIRHQPDGGLVHQNPIALQENTVYVRLRNRGGSAASGEVQVFWDRSRIGWPCKVGEPNVGTIPFENLAPGEVRIVSLQWEPEEVGEHGLHTVIEAGGDPADGSSPCSPHRPRWDNNVSWHNVIVYMHPTASPQQALAVEEAEVELVNPYDWSKDVDLVVERGTFPTTGTITLRLEQALFDRWWSYEGGWSEGVEVDEAARLITVTGEVSATVGSLPMEPSEEATATLTFDAPEEGEFEVTLHEIIDGQVVGGITYRWLVADATPPDVVATSPASEAVEVALDAPIVITFTEEIGPLSFDLTLEPDPGAWNLAWNEAGTVFTATYGGFVPATTYTAAVMANDASANPMAEPYAWSFTVKETYSIFLPLVLRNH